MATLETMQRYAERIAVKLGVDTMPVLRWYGAPCKGLGRAYAHCHFTTEPELPRGTICIGRRRAESDRGSWRYLIAHEVTHLRVKDHNSQAFLKWAVRLGFADNWQRRKLAATGALRHRHEWTAFTFTGVAAQRRCHLCNKTETGTITWKHG